MLSNLAVFALAGGKQCFSSVTQHHVNQANICAQGVRLTIWSSVSRCVALMLHCQAWDITLLLDRCTLLRNWMRWQKCVMTMCFCLSWDLSHVCTKLPCDQLPRMAAGHDLSLITESFRLAQTEHKINIAHRKHQTLNLIVPKPAFGKTLKC